MLFTHIQSLLQVRDTPSKALRGVSLAQLPQIEDAWLLVEDGHILDFGPMSQCPSYAGPRKNVSGRLVLPAWVDAHTHLVFATTREEEFVDRLRGLSYQEIAARGGGILNSARKLRALSEDQLFDEALLRLQELIRLGTGAIEIKSGYGLDTESELKMLRVVRRLREVAPIPVKATFLGAHAVPETHTGRREAYMDLVLNEMLPQVAEQKLADYVDIFCEKGFFSVEDTRRLILAGKKYGLPAKIHTNQFNCMGGVEVAAALGALSVDHLEVISEQAIQHLQKSETLPVLLPTAAFFLRDPYQPARQLIEAGLPVVLASDYNPGSSPSGNMNFVLSLACIALRMTPEEAINAATLNAAFALELQSELGSIARGKRANLIVTREVPSVAYLPYAFGSNWIEEVWINGEPISG